MSYYRGPQVCKIVGITYRQLDHWARTDLLRPSVSDATGSGSQRLYSYGDLVELRTIKQMLDAGISLARARTAIAYLRENLGQDLATADLVIRGKDSLLVRDREETIDLFRRGQGAMSFIALHDVKEEVDAAIRELDPPVEDTGSGEPAVSSVAN
ncbi:MAG: putative transcriptional regulator [Actinomycetia bacterium]|nr:putative transcriptional regulator [Actinomycetes bacterium]